MFWKKNLYYFFRPYFMIVKKPEVEKTITALKKINVNDVYLGVPEDLKNSGADPLR